MPTLLATQTLVDEFVAANLAVLTARQENFRTNRGRYWQGLSTHVMRPSHTNGSDGSAPGDRLLVHPTDQFDDWDAVFPEWRAGSVLLPAALRIDVYDGPDGRGWAIVIEFLHAGTLWRRVINVGPETSRSKPWTLTPLGP